MKFALAIAFVVVGLAMAASIDKDESRRALDKLATKDLEKELERRALEALAAQDQKEANKERRDTGDNNGNPTKRDTGDNNGNPTKRDTGDNNGNPTKRDTGDNNGNPTKRDAEEKKEKDDARRNIEKEEDKERREISTSSEFRWETIPIAENASQCIYSPESHTISCRGMSGLVECPATMEAPGVAKVEVFGMRRHPVKSMVSDVEKRIYELYPRKLDNTTYMNFTQVIDGKPVELYLFFSETSGDMSGVRVTDKKCYMRVINVVLSQATAEHEVKVEGTDLKVDLFGEILNAEKPNNKRWLGFGWPWMWGMGMWGWGLGWGLPFWG